MKVYAVFLVIAITMISSMAYADWFDKNYSSDTKYIRIDEMTGVAESTQTFVINVTAPVYLKVVGKSISPWLISGSGWYLDLYLRPTLSSDWVLVDNNVNSTRPSDEVVINAGETAELKAVVYYPVEITTALTDDLAPGDDEIECLSTKAFPESGVVKIEDECIRYRMTENGIMSELMRGYMDTIEEHHPSGTEVSLYSGVYHIPIIIAINTSDGSAGGGGGSIHPSACHSIDMKIATGTPPVAVFRYTCWYNKVTVNASNSYDPDGTIASYQWDFTDDGVYDAIGEEAEWEYGSEGYYRITLKVTDNDAMTSMWSQIVSVHMPPESNSLFNTRIFGMPLWQLIIIIVVGIIGVKILSKVLVAS